MSTSRVEVIDGDRLEDLRDEWRALWESYDLATPFQAPAWLLPWARRYAPGRFWAATLRLDGRLTALLPVFYWKGTILLAGTGPSDYGDGVLPMAEGTSAGRLIEALAEVFDESVEQIDLQQLPTESSLLRAQAPVGWSETLAQGEVCPLLLLRGRDGMERVPKRWRSNWRYALRRIGREGGRLDLVPPQEVLEAMEALESLHALRWRERGEPGVLSDPLLRGFLREAAPELAQDGLLRLHRLRFGDETVAVLLALVGRRDTYYYLSGFDPAYAALSPGTALVGAAIAQAAQEGAAAFHFLRGQERYKYRWGAEDRATERWTLRRVK